MLNPFNKKAKYAYDYSYFERVDTPNKAYFLGFLYADGNVSKSKSCFNLTLQQDDEHILQKLLDEICPDGVIKHYKNNSGRVYSYLQINSKKIKEDLIKLGVVPDKTFVIKFPSEEQVPSHLIPHFIRGYFDGDGTITNKPKQKSGNVEICGTESFLHSVSHLLRMELGFNELPIRVANKDYPKTKVYLFSGNNNLYKFYNLIYENAESFLARKRERFINIFNFFPDKYPVQC